MNKIKFIDKFGSFQCENPDLVNGLYFPLASEVGLKSAVTPNLGGDAKLDQNHFLMEPVSIENLHNNRSTRNFWLVTPNNVPWSVTGASVWQAADRFTDKKEQMTLEAGFMWHHIKREASFQPLTATITSFVPYWCNCEIMQVAIKNTGKEAITFTPVAAIPVYGRSADNIRDHRHVTSLLHRITVHEKGVVVNPTLSFDERGHQVNDTLYYVLGQEGDGSAPVSFYPDVESFIGEGGNFECPGSLLNMAREMAQEMEREMADGKTQPLAASVPAGTVINGQEALGGLVFETVTLHPGETKEYTVFTGACQTEVQWKEVLANFTGSNDVHTAFEKNKAYWQEKVNVAVHTEDETYDMFLKWVCFQPELRRIYGCSFLPHHDYGKGGRGWRDLWQDCLALLLMNPGSVRDLLLDNFRGVRIDGSNATIIGEKQGEFKADRNGITRVWMDHGVWPFITTLLYLNQTGDTAFLYEKMPYFRDRQVMRGKELLAESTSNYQGTVLEHLLLQNLCAFWEVGEHNYILLRDADWNDALDMANERGESVAFSNAYGKNLLDLAKVLFKEAQKGVKTVELLEEISMLLEESLYDDAEGKRQTLNKYLEACKYCVSGKTMQVDTVELAKNLERKGQWILNHIRKTEWVTDGEGNGWYNGYYDNSGNRVEGVYQKDAEEKQIRMMLTSQVFSIMGGTASKQEIESIVKSADKYLYDENCGGYRLNTDFEEVKTDMGRMFGFAYGEKENGAVFSHMAVMFANALYQRGFAKEGYKALHTLYRQAMDVDKSRIFPGIPEYFGAGGRGLYHYLTGAASWYMLTVITQMFGVRGEDGQLVLEPKLLASQFKDSDTDGSHASIELTLMKKKWHIEYVNKTGAEYGEYEIDKILLDGADISETAGFTCEGSKAARKAILPGDLILALDETNVHHLVVTLK